MKKNKSTVNTILELAFNELGYAEKPVNRQKYSKEFGVPVAQWCGFFVMWIFRKANRDIVNTAYTPNGVAAWKKLDRWHEEGDPKSGDIVYFDFSRFYRPRPARRNLCKDYGSWEDCSLY